MRSSARGANSATAGGPGGVTTKAKAATTKRIAAAVPP